MGLASRGPSMGQLFLKCLFEVDEAARGRTIKCQVVLKRTNLIHKSFPENESDKNGHAGAI